MEEAMDLPDTDRLLISMPLRIMGIDALGRPFEEASKTVDINKPAYAVDTITYNV